MAHELDVDTFAAVLDAVPLVSIDLLVTDPVGQLLVGRRVNEPAKGFFFVPGGRIRKDETLDKALARIAKDELGVTDVAWDDANVVGVFTHRYDANALGKPGVSTHYVVLAYRLHDTEDLDLDESQYSRQHSEYRWIGEEDAEDAALRRIIHPNTLAYFDRLDAPMTIEQYVLLNSRRDVANARVWQTPVVGLTGLAFLFTVLLAGDTSAEGRWIAAVLAVLICVAAIQLTAKQRFTEETLAREAENFERSRRMNRLNRQRVPRDRFRAYSSVRLWRWLFVLAAVGAVVAAAVLSSR